MQGQTKVERARGWGPFTGRQLTTVIVAIAAAFVLAPVAATAASSVLTSASNATPAVKGTNTGSAGTGVYGTGAKFGVFSNGPLGVAAGKPLSCTGCVKAPALAKGSVGPAALSATAKGVQPLPSGQSESGVFYSGVSAVASGFVAGSISFPRPLTDQLRAPFIVEVQPGQGTATHCEGIGLADPGYLCLYDQLRSNITTFGALPLRTYGTLVSWGVTAVNAQAGGMWTLTAP